MDDIKYLIRNVSNRHFRNVRRKTKIEEDWEDHFKHCEEIKPKDMVYKLENEKTHFEMTLNELRKESVHIFIKELETIETYLNMSVITKTTTNYIMIFKKLIFGKSVLVEEKSKFDKFYLIGLRRKIYDFMYLLAHM